MTVEPRSHDDTERYIQEQEHELDPDLPPSEFSHFDCRICGPGPLGWRQIPSQWEHVFYRVETVLHEQGYDSWNEDIRHETGPSKAELVSSELKNERGIHTIMLDIDLPARLVESSTREHYHLYIDHKLPWWRYKRLLRALYRAGVIERGYYRMSKRRRATHLRPPWIKK